MDWNRFEGNWKQFKGNVKEKWGRLTDDDLDVINGRREQLEARSRNGMASPRIKPGRMSKTGSRPYLEASAPPRHDIIRYKAISRGGSAGD